MSKKIEELLERFSKEKDPFFDLRLEMVEKQIKERGITDERILKAFLAVPRHIFVPERVRAFAYDDTPLPLFEGQTISQPYIVALMVELLEPSEDKHILEIGTGSGYETAILSLLNKYVYTVERIKDLCDYAKEKLKELSVSNVYFHVGDGSEGCLDFAPYDGIICSAAAPDIPEPFIEQLNPGGIIVIPVGDRFSQDLVKVTKTKTGLKKEYYGPCAFVPLIGRYGFSEFEY
ncbi:MAG: protein-L-isoaspartate(D-aspartate) O-methyltransferase [Candidatus Hydrothermales bacterium]